MNTKRIQLNRDTIEKQSVVWAKSPPSPAAKQNASKHCSHPEVRTRDGRRASNLTEHRPISHNNRRKSRERCEETPPLSSSPVTRKKDWDRRTDDDFDQSVFVRHHATTASIGCCLCAGLSRERSRGSRNQCPYWPEQQARAHAGDRHFVDADDGRGRRR